MSRNPFTFGENWLKFTERNLDAGAIREAKQSLTQSLPSLAGKSFLDVGSGSGLFSYCAHELGASRVVSVDVDPNSVIRTIGQDSTSATISTAACMTAPSSESATAR